MTTVIELNDLELSLFKGLERLYCEPGFAIVRDDELLFGEAALRLARMHPQQANQQYFSRMNADPLSQPVQAAANHADLVYLHLKELGGLAREDAVLAVPGTMNGDQLGILLGICQEADIQVSGFVNAAVASIATIPSADQVTHLDIYLQHMLVSELAVGAEVRHERAFEVKDCGFQGLLDGWVNLIADRFVQETRFDPLHNAESEQQLYNQVYDWAVGAHHRGEVAIQISHGEQQRRVEVSKSKLEQKAQQRIDRLVDALPSRSHLVLTARTARIPGLADRLKSTGFELTLLAADAVPTGCSEHLDRIRTVETELRLVTRLPHEHAVATAGIRTGPAPTHLLKGHQARPFAAADLPVRVRSTEDGPWISGAPGVTLNGRTLSADARLALGDVIGLGTDTYTAIRLED